MVGRPFPKGLSGNRGGRPKAAHNIQELARKHAPEAIQTLADIAKNGTPGARVSAAIALLDRAYGKPPQFNTGDTGNFRKAIDMTDDELAAIVGRAKLTLVKLDT
jgi:hypothetical protein